MHLKNVLPITERFPDRRVGRTRRPRLSMLARSRRTSDAPPSRRVAKFAVEDRAPRSEGADARRRRGVGRIVGAAAGWFLASPESRARDRSRRPSRPRRSAPAAARRRRRSSSPSSVYGFVKRISSSRGGRRPGAATIRPVGPGVRASFVVSAFALTALLSTWAI
jgi:hypothetical protein